MNHTVVDVGSNTIRLSVYQPQDDGTFTTLFSDVDMTGLNSYISQGLMSQEGMIRAAEVLNQFRHTIAQLGLPPMEVFATACLRNIKNSQEAVQFIFDHTGLHIDVVSGEEEAALSFHGIRADIPVEEGYLFDMGGGSTEVVTIQSGQLQAGISIPQGSLSLFNRHVEGIFPTDDELIALRTAITAVLDESPLPQTPMGLMCGVGGTAYSIIRVANEYFGAPTTNRSVTVPQLKELSAQLSRRDKTARNLILRRCPDRVHTVIPGLLLMEALCDRLCTETIYVSDYGVREGYLCHKILKNTI